MTEPLSISRILVVDDEQAVADEYLKALAAADTLNSQTVLLDDLRSSLFGGESAAVERPGFHVDQRSQGEAAVEAVEQALHNEQPYSVIFLDIDMPPGIDGIEAAKRIRALDDLINIVIVSGSGGVRLQQFNSNFGASTRCFFFQKPFHTIEVRQLATALCGKWQSDLALRKANDNLEDRVKRRTAQLHSVAYYDSSTQLPNRNKLLYDLARAVDEGAGGNECIAIVLLDVDRFGFFNETMGYECGTALLLAVRDRLRTVLREADIAGRFGADEFACIIRGYESSDELHKIVARIQSVFHNPFEIADRTLNVSAAIGVAGYPEHGKTAEEIFRCAEAALNRSKRHVIHAPIYYEQEMGQLARRKLSLERELREAISTAAIFPALQAQMCLHKGTIISAEALARWTKPCGTAVPPDHFVPLAEEIGLSDELFELMLRQICETLSQWRDWDGHPAISVNVSAQQIRNKDFSNTIFRTLRSFEIPFDRLKIELTESVLLDDFDSARALLLELSEKGIALEVDDFGTGYSSLSYLAELPVSALKIDRSFVSAMNKSDASMRLIKSIIALGHGLGLKVIAEGIESQRELDQLQAFGCDLVQGYFIGKPIPAAEFSSSLQQIKSVDIAAQ